MAVSSPSGDKPTTRKGQDATLPASLAIARTIVDRRERFFA
jgi:hypothetical protein